MSSGLALEILEYNHQHDRSVYRAALDAVAQFRRVRTVFLERQPRTDQHAQMLATLTRPGLELAADTLLRNWLLKQHTGVLTDFLDALQIKHEKGVVEDLPKTIADETLRTAVAKWLEKHRPEVVAVYLHAFNVMNAETWANLDVLLQEDARLCLGGAAKNS
jgi:hypothetical protein